MKKAGSVWDETLSKSKWIDNQEKISIETIAKALGL